jgi:hypothetical protein
VATTKLAKSILVSRGVKKNLERRRAAGFNRQQEAKIGPKADGCLQVRPTMWLNTTRCQQLVKSRASIGRWVPRSEALQFRFCLFGQVCQSTAVFAGKLRILQ